MEKLSALFYSMERDLFPALAEDFGPLDETERSFIRAVELIRPEGFARGGKANGRRGRPEKSRLKLFCAFIMKSQWNCSETRELLRLLKSSPRLRRLCGWGAKIPSESTFSRAFAEFAADETPLKAHNELIASRIGGDELRQVSIDSSAIRAREKVGKDSKSMPPLAKQITNPLKENLVSRPTGCDWGCKTSSDGNPMYWKGYKLHLAATDGDIPVGAFISSASLHDVNMAIPLLQDAHGKISFGAVLADAAYDAKEVRWQSRLFKALGIIDFNRRRGEPSELEPAQKLFYRRRSCVERVFSYLKDSFGCRKIMVKGAKKIMAHLMFAILTLTVRQMRTFACPPAS